VNGTSPRASEEKTRDLPESAGSSSREEKCASGKVQVQDERTGITKDIPIQIAGWCRMRIS